MDLFRRFLRRKSAVIGLAVLAVLLLIALTADLWISEEQVVGQNIAGKLQAPSAAHPFGTDELGRDLFWRVLYGTRYSLLIGVSATLLSLLLGVPFGLLAGDYGGWRDQLIMRITDVFSALPSVLTALAVVAVLGSSPVNLVLAVGISAVPLFVRVTRAAVLDKTQELYVEASRAMGGSDLHIILKHIVPNACAPVLVQGTLRVASAMIAASGLSFLGLGIGAPTPEWGALLSAGRNFIRGQGYLCFFPGLFITITVLAFNLVGDGLRDAMDNGDAI